MGLAVMEDFPTACRFRPRPKRGPTLGAIGCGPRIFEGEQADMEATRQIRDVRCPSCSAPRYTPLLTAYVYCDFCATFFDFDWSIACREEELPALGKSLPEQNFQKWYGELSHEITAARADGPARQAAWARIFMGHIGEVPSAFSPRVGDPSYLEPLVYGFLAPATVRMSDDPEVIQAWGAVTQTYLNLPQIKEGFDRETLQRCVSAQLDLWDREAAALEDAGLFGTHPDDLTPELYVRHKRSVFAQDWVRRMRSADRTWLIRALHIEVAYIEVKMPTTRDGFCGRCGHPRTMVEGASRMVCEACGCIIGGEGDLMDCVGCGSALFLPSGFEHRVHCPRCQSAYMT